MSTDRPPHALLGAALLAFVLGSLHAFSVLLLAMEAEFSVSRSTASLTYSIALAALAAAVLWGHRVYARVTPSAYVAATGTLAAVGCLIAAFSASSGLIWLGYGVVFGAANGMGYGYALQFAGRVRPERKGMAMGIVTAAYALGAVAFPWPLRKAVDLGGWTAALLFLALSLLVFAALSAVALRQSGGVFASDIKTGVPAKGAGVAKNIGRPILWLWLSYGGAVTAGLMAIGHATGLAQARDGDTVWIVAAPIVIAGANMAGSLLAGGLTDRIGGRSVLAALAALSGLSLLVMAFSPDLTITVIGLGVVGFCYGGTIAAYPAYISHRFGAAMGTLVFARVFTAWAAAGVLGPLAAGVLYDRFHSYQLALILAAVAAVLSFALIQTKAWGRS